MWFVRALFSRATTTQLFDFGVFSLWPKFHFAHCGCFTVYSGYLAFISVIRKVTLHFTLSKFHGGTYSRWRLFEGNGARWRGHIQHRCPGGSVRGQLSVGPKSRPGLLRPLTLPSLPLLGRAKSFKDQGNLIASKNASGFLLCENLLIFYLLTFHSAPWPSCLRVRALSYSFFHLFFSWHSSFLVTNLKLFELSHWASWGQGLCFTHPLCIFCTWHNACPGPHSQ